MGEASRRTLITLVVGMRSQVSFVDISVVEANVEKYEPASTKEKTRYIGGKTARKSEPIK